METVSASQNIFFTKQQIMNIASYTIYLLTIKQIHHINYSI